MKGQATESPISCGLGGCQQALVVAQTAAASGAFLNPFSSDIVPQARTGNMELAEWLPGRCEDLGSVPSATLQKLGQHLGIGGRGIRSLKLSLAT